MSRADSQDHAPKNPKGFRHRLQLLMDGWGFTSRDIAARTHVSHMTVENWLTDKHQAGAEQVAEVASVFGWTYSQLYAGEPPADVMDRLAELHAFRARVCHIAERLADAAGGRWIAAIPSPHGSAASSSDGEVNASGSMGSARAAEIVDATGGNRAKQGRRVSPKGRGRS